MQMTLIYVEKHRYQCAIFHFIMLRQLLSKSYLVSLTGRVFIS